MTTPSNTKPGLLLPRYMNEKGNVARLVVLTAAFALLFVNIYQPFNSGTWVTKFNDNKSADVIYFLYSSLITLIGMCVIAISRSLMYHYSKKHDISLWAFLAVVLLEILLMAIVYSCVQIFVLERDNTTQVLERFFESYKGSIKKTSLVLLIPYALLWLYFALRDKAKMLETAKEQETLPVEPVAKAKNEMISFCDEKGELRLSVDKSNLYFIESADNYVKIYYMNKGRMVHFLLRNSLKNIDELFGNDVLLRCHRSYMVNFDKVKVLRKGEEGLCLDLDHESVPNIPITRTYHDRVMERFSASTTTANKLN